MKCQEMEGWRGLMVGLMMVSSSTIESMVLGSSSGQMGAHTLDSGLLASNMEKAFTSIPKGRRGRECGQLGSTCSQTLHLPERRKKNKAHLAPSEHRPRTTAPHPTGKPCWETRKTQVTVLPYPPHPD